MKNYINYWVSLICEDMDEEDINTNCEKIFSGKTEIMEKDIPNALREKITIITIPDSVVTIGNNTFDGCKSLKEIRIGNGVKTIGDNAFLDCRKLKNIIFGENVESIGKYAFFRCYNIETINLNSKIKTIGEDAFDECTSLETVFVDRTSPIKKDYMLGKYINWGLKPKQIKLMK